MKIRIALKVRAGARRTEFAGRLGTTWKLQVAAPPVDGKANEAILRFLSNILAVPPSSIRILTGLSSPSKIIEIDGADAEQVERAILESHGPGSHTGSPSPRKP
jgi:uncharacterized protein (TIGR00251 family)